MTKIMRFYIYIFTFLCMFIVFATTSFAYTSFLPTNNGNIIQLEEGEKTVEKGKYEEEVDYPEDVFQSVIPVIVIIMAVRYGIIMRNRI